MKTRNIRYHGEFDVSLETLDLEPMKKNEIRCKAIKSLVSIGSETIVYRRQFDALHRYPSILLSESTPFGYSMTAEVIDVGEDVKGYKAGDIVYATNSHAQYFNIEPDLKVVEKKPVDISVDELCWNTLLRCSLYAVMKAEVKPGSTVVILGQGILGTGCVQFARILGASKIIVADPLKTRAERAYKFGATNSYQAYGSDIIDIVKELNDGKLADAVIDATASAEGFSQACELTRRAGHISLLADPPNPLNQHIGPSILINYLNVHGVYIRMQVLDVNAFEPLTVQDIHNRIYSYIRSGELDVKGMITGYESPENCKEVYQMLYENRDEHLGIIYDWSLVK